MMKTKKVILCAVIVAIIAFSWGCSEKPSSKAIDIKWGDILPAQKQMNFCEINLGFSSGDFLIGYSHPFALGAGFKILEAKFGGDSLSVNVLLQGEKEVISHITRGENVVGCILHHLENADLRTTLLVGDSTGIWAIKDIPIKGLRKVFFLKDRWLIEGDLNGTGQVFESIDRGISWKKIELLTKGYKSFYLVDPLPQGNSIFCIGSTSYNEKDSKLLLFNSENGDIEEMIDIESSTSYIKPISKTNLHVIVDGDKIKLYSYSDRKLHLEKTIKAPRSDCKVANFYIDEDLVVITMEPLEIGAKMVSWISYDQGSQWEPFHQEKQLRLINNSLGELFVINSENNIRRGYY